MSELHQVKADTLPSKGCYFNSASQFRKKLKIKALRKDPKALAKKENVVQLPRMKALFNLVCLFFSRLKIETKISLQMCISMCTFRHHITVLTYILS